MGERLEWHWSEKCASSQKWTACQGDERADSEVWPLLCGPDLLHGRTGWVGCGSGASSRIGDSLLCSMHVGPSSSWDVVVDREMMTIFASLLPLAGALHVGLNRNTHLDTVLTYICTAI